MNVRTLRWMQHVGQRHGRSFSSCDCHTTLAHMCGTQRNVSPKRRKERSVCYSILGIFFWWHCKIYSTKLSVCTRGQYVYCTIEMYTQIHHCTLMMIRFLCFCEMANNPIWYVCLCVCNSNHCTIIPPLDDRMVKSKNSRTLSLKTESGCVFLSPKTHL